MFLYILKRLIIFGLYVYLWAIAFIVLLSLTLAVLGKSLGIRKFLANLFIKLFEWVTISLEQDSRKRKKCQGEEESEAEWESESSTVISDQKSDLIEKDASSKVSRKMNYEEPEGCKVFVVADDSMDFIKAGVEAIIEDDVTIRFSNKQLHVWNLLTRTSYGYQYFSLKYTIIWILGLLFRYCILLPVRFIIFCVGMVLLVTSTAVIGCLPTSKFKEWLNWHASLMSFRVLSRALSIVATYHNKENIAKNNGICVANHTSPMDVQLLSMDNCYAMVGQKQGGILGLIQKCLSRASSHIWFERAEASDREAVRKRLKEHVEDHSKNPILIFPEGVCINNTSVMMFKKGSFEVGGVIYPTAIKYDSRFGEAFWGDTSYLQYILMIMTSWGIVVDVWYLPPMTIKPGESGIEFAARVKHAIASAGGLVELEWDGKLKQYMVNPEMLAKQRQKEGQRIQRAPSKSKNSKNE